MRIACVYFPHLYMQIEKLKQPQLEGYPVIIGGMPEERESVADCSEEAAAQGVCAGMSLRQAYHLCPEALFLPFGGRYERIWEDILFALGAFTLRVEPTIPGLAYLDITEALKIYGNERALASAIIQEMLTSLRVQVRVGVGNSRFIAKQAALSAWDVLIVEPGEEKAFLSLLSVETLPLPDKEKEHLRLLGLSTLKKVAGLSRKALISQFGSMGNVLFEIVNGADEKKPIPRRQNALCLERETTCEAPLQTSEEVRAVMEGMVAGLSDELNRMRLACRKVKLILFLQDGSSLEKALVMKKPTAEAHAYPWTAFRVSGISRGEKPCRLVPVIRSRSCGRFRGPGGPLPQEVGLCGATGGHQGLLRRPLRAFPRHEDRGGGGMRPPAGEEVQVYQCLEVRAKRGLSGEARRALLVEGVLNPNIGRVPIIRSRMRVARDGLPVMVQVRKRNLRVREIMNTWRIEEEWWREPISRLYFFLELENGARLTLFIENGNWYRQNWV